jgi:hypothetical protein
MDCSSWTNHRLNKAAVVVGMALDVSFESKKIKKTILYVKATSPSHPHENIFFYQLVFESNPDGPRNINLFHVSCTRT